MIVIFLSQTNLILFYHILSYFILQIANPIPTHISILVPTIALGIVGGIMGAIFTTVNVRILRLRAFVIGKIPHPTAQKFARVLETVVYAVSGSYKLCS